MIDQPVSDKIGEKIIELLNRNGTEKFNEFYIVTALITKGGINGIKQAILNFKNKGGVVKAVVGLDLPPSKEGLQLLTQIADESYVYDCSNDQSMIFHPKLYIIKREDMAIIFVGSSNLTHGGFFVNHELNFMLQLELSSKKDKQVFSKCMSIFNRYSDLSDLKCKVLTNNLIEELEDLGKTKSELGQHSINTDAESFQPEVNLEKIRSSVLMQIDNNYNTIISQSIDNLPPIKVGRRRILRPVEYVKLLVGAGKGIGGFDNQVNLQTLLFTGLRYKMALQFKDNIEWYDPKGFINLSPKFLNTKKSGVYVKRQIKITPQSKDTIDLFFHTKPLPITSGGWVKNLTRWGENEGIDPTGLYARTTQWTWEAWLFTSYPDRETEIMDRQGYGNWNRNKVRRWIKKIKQLPFTEEDKIHMGRFVKGL